MPTLDVCVVGEINLDLILYGLPKELVLDRELLASGLALTLGSSSAIFAHNLAMLGNKVGFISKTGGDALGKMALERLSVAGVDVGRVKQATGRTATGLTVVLPYLNQRYILTYPGTMFELQYSDIDMGYVRSARHLHVSSFFLHRALRQRIADLFRQAKAAGLSTSLDTNDDPENKWDRDLLEVLKYVDVFLPNDREAKKNVVLAIRLVSAELGNTPAICRASYVHPIILARYLDHGETILPRASGKTAGGHYPEERALIRFLDEHFPERRKRVRAEDKVAA